MERLAFGYGSSRFVDRMRTSFSIDRPKAASPTARLRGTAGDWTFIFAMLFTAVLFFRPQDQIPGLGRLPLAELAAVGGILSLAIGHLSGRAPLCRTSPEFACIVGLGVLMLGLAPLSIWMGGVVRLFTDVYVKIVLIVMLMMNALRSPQRLDRFVSLILLATGYLGMRAVFDYARGVNMIEDYGRVRGAVGGIFGNPNDLALNMVAFLPFAMFRVISQGSALRRLSAAAGALFMTGAIVVSQSRSGTLGLAAVLLLGGAQLARRSPGLTASTALVLLLALPLVPGSYWERVASITDASKDQTGSRETRSTLFREGLTAFFDRPLTGVGAGQFKNYKPEQREQAWNETHNVLLQVAAELGLIGLVVFSFLVVRALLAGGQVRRLLRKMQSAAPTRGSPAGGVDVSGPLTPAEARLLETHALATTVAVVGWLVCALFASVAYNWTLYYLVALAIIPRDFLVDRLQPQRRRSRAAALRASVAR
jgi:O-antigen ligase